MKTIKVILLTFLILSSCSILFSQQPFNKLNNDIEKRAIVIKSNPFPIIYGPIPFTNEFRLVGEMVTSRNNSVQLGVSYLGKSLIFAYQEKNDTSNSMDEKFIVRGIRIQGAYKFYLTKAFYGYNVHKGLYLAPFISYSSAMLSTKSLINLDIFINGTYIDYDLLFGYQKMYRDIIVLDVFTGLGYKDNNLYDHFTNKYKKIEEEALNNDIHLKFILGFNIGICISCLID